MINNNLPEGVKEYTYVERERAINGAKIFSYSEPVNTFFLAKHRERKEILISEMYDLSTKNHPLLCYMLSTNQHDGLNFRYEFTNIFNLKMLFMALKTNKNILDIEFSNKKIMNEEQTFEYNFFVDECNFLLERNKRNKYAEYGRQRHQRNLLS